MTLHFQTMWFLVIVGKATFILKEIQLIKNLTIMVTLKPKQLQNMEQGLTRKIPKLGHANIFREFFRKTCRPSFKTGPRLSHLVLTYIRPIFPGTVTNRS